MSGYVDAMLALVNQVQIIINVSAQREIIDDKYTLFFLGFSFTNRCIAIPWDKSP